MFPWKKALLAGVVLVLDGALLLVLGVLLMDYDDSYSGPTEEYGAWHTMTPFQRGVSVSWWLWAGVNALALLAVVFWLFKRRTRLIP